MSPIHIRNPEEYQEIFKKENLVGYDAILLITRDIFLTRGAFRQPGEHEAYFDSLTPENKQRLGDFTYFYYHTTRPWETSSGKHTIRDESRLVAITSIMEKLMSKEEHIDFFHWYARKYPGQNSIEDLTTAKELYLTDFGVHRKFMEYMRTHVVDTNRDELLMGIEIYEDGKFRQLENIDEAAKMLYKMRSDFVHNAKMAVFTKPESIYPLTISVGSVSYRLMMDIEYYMAIFEKSFTKYWLEQSNP